MSQLRPAALLAMGLCLPFAAWGTSADINLEPADFDARSATQVVPDGVSDTLPPVCELSSPGDAADKADAQTAACCWFYHMGRWWCVSC
jgi:hypothetical protein